MRKSVVRGAAVCATLLCSTGLAYAQNTGSADGASAPAMASSSNSSSPQAAMTASGDNSVATTTTTAPASDAASAPAATTTTTEKHGFDLGWLGLIGLAGLLGLRRRPETATMVSGKGPAARA